jgi:hypothetical protein
MALDFLEDFGLKIELLISKNRGTVILPCFATPKLCRLQVQKLKSNRNSRT